MTKFLLFFAGLVMTGSALAAGPALDLQNSQANVRDPASLQRGARLFMNYCLSCHSAEYQRYSRTATDLGLTEEQMMQNLVFTGAGYFDTMHVAMDQADATAWFGAPPPDLTLTARAKKGGADWVYTYLNSFYLDETRPVGWNNTLLPGASMPHVLWELQGVQRAIYEPDEAGNAQVVGFEKVAEGSLSDSEYQQAIRDISAFMAYIAEPAALQRYRYGVWVMLYLTIFTFMAWLLKREYWRDIH